MHQTLFAYPATLYRYRTAPLLAERERFLHHCAQQGFNRTALEKIAWLLCIIANSPITRRSRVRRTDLDGLGRGYRPSTRPVLIHVATQWFSFMGRPQLEPLPESPFSAQINGFENSMRERGLSEATILTRHEQLLPFFRTLERVNRLRSLREITLQHIDQHFIDQSKNGWSRASLATLANTLRTFFRYTEAQRWSPSGLASAIDSPCVYAQESLPRGPDWPQVQALVASIKGEDAVSIRDRAVIMLLAIYGLRCGEVAALRLEDLDWENERICVTRPKSRRIQRYPLIGSVGDALIRYLKHGRPRCRCREVFLSAKAPTRPLPGGSISAIVRYRLIAMGITGIPRGAHGLRHACARHLLAQGFSFKQIGDQLGHRCATATSFYAKVDLNGLRQVAELSLGRLV